MGNLKSSFVILWRGYPENVILGVGKTYEDAFAEAVANSCLTDEEKADNSLILCDPLTEEAYNDLKKNGGDDMDALVWDGRAWGITAEESEYLN